ncbi:MAG: HprK-related kinase B [Myxococcales bacterium FL481]|nr:MAG: HprK-related kinase B [Myxococcales bacterium FL481]
MPPSGLSTTSLRSVTVTESVPSLAALEREARGVQAAAHQLHLRFLDELVRVDSNSSQLVAELADYFSEFCAPPAPPTISVTALDAPVPSALAELPYSVVVRTEPGKRAKEAFVDLDQGRVIHKVRTDMVFLCGPSTNLAIGPAVQNVNQIVNFINTRLLDRQLDAGGLLGHCSAVLVNGRALVFAGVPGAGKSTLALELMRRDDVQFLSNDRVTFHPHASGVDVVGVPKHPRINPGTALANDKLRRVMSTDDIARFSAMSRDELWPLEHKYDALIDRCFGPGRFVLKAPVAAVFVLAWSHRDLASSARCRRISLAEDPAALAAIMKSPGPFRLGPMVPLASQEPEYRTKLAPVPVYRIDGAVDFAAGCDWALSVARGEEPAGSEQPS